MTIKSQIVDKNPIFEASPALKCQGPSRVWHVIRKAYRRQGIDDKEATLKQSCKPLVEWASFCHDTNSDIFHPKTETVVTWLSTKYAKGASFGALDTYRAALSLIISEKK